MFAYGDLAYSQEPFALLTFSSIIILCSTSYFYLNTNQNTILLFDIYFRYFKFIN